MSASKDRQNRQERIAAGTDKRTSAKAKEQAKQRKQNILYTAVGIAVVLFVAFVLFYNSAYLTRHTTAVTIDGQNYSAAQLNYYYSNNYMNFYGNYGDYISYFFDPNESLADQPYDEDMSWRDYFLDSAAQNMAQIQMLVTEAEAEGFTLSEEQQAEYDEEVKSMETAWESLGYSNLQQYLNMNFGKGVNIDMVKEEMYRSHLASAYSESKYDSFEYSDEELDDYYAEHADELDVIDYAYYSIPVETEDTEEDAGTAEEDAGTAEEDAGTAEEDAGAAEEDAGTAEEDAGTAEEDAGTAEEDAGTAEEDAGTAEEEYTPSEGTQAIADAVDGTDEDSFAGYLAELDEGAEPTVESLAGGNLYGPYTDWLLDAAREPGDAAAFASETEEYVVMFLGRDTNDYNTVSFRHILAQAQDADGDGTFSDEEIEAAAEEAQGYYDEWQDGDATEDSFAELANENSDDTGSNTNGGLYENTARGIMVEPINDWLFDESRKAGDTTVVSYEGDNYTGTHVLYFVGEDDMTYAHYQADQALRSDAYNAWSEEKMADYEPVTSHLRMCGKNH